MYYPILGPKSRKKAIEKGLDCIVGQPEAKSILFDVLNSALARSDRACPVRLLVTGPAGEGKTSIIKAMAKTLGIPFVETDGTQLKNVSTLAKNMLEALAKEHSLPLNPEESETTAVYEMPPMIVLIDEAHEMSDSMQNSLLKATESNDGLLVALKANLILKCKAVTWVMATTNPGQFNGPLATRFAFEVPMYRSTPKEVSEIVYRSYMKKGFTQEMCDRIVYYSGKIPRVALLFAEKVHLYIKSNKPGDLIKAVEEVARRDRIDEFGMKYECRRILNLLQQYPDRGLLLRELISYLEADEQRLKNDYLAVLMSKPSCREESLVSRDDRYFISKEGINWLECQYPLHVASKVLHDYSNDNIRLIVEEFTSTLYRVVVYSHEGMVLQGAHCVSLKEAELLTQEARAAFNL